MVQILADPLKKPRLRVITLKRRVATAVKLILLRRWTARKYPPLGRAVRPAILSEWSSVPGHSEGVSFGAAIGVFNSDDGSATVSRVANELLSAAAINPGKTEIGGVGGHYRATFEAAPLGGLSVEIPKNGITSSNLDLGSTVDHKFGRALTTARVPSAEKYSPPRESLGRGDRTCY